MATQKEVAQHLDVTQQAVSKMTLARVLTRKRKGGYDIDQCRVAYVRHLREQAAGRAAAGEGPTLVSERARLASAQAEAQEVRNAVARRELLPVGDYVRALTAAVTDVRARFLAMPAALAPELISIDERQEMADRLTAEMHAALEALSEQNFDAIMEAAFGGDGTGDEDREAAAEADSERVE